MLIDEGRIEEFKGEDGKLDFKKMAVILKIQTDAWVFESHCWVMDMSKGVQVCAWCKRERVPLPKMEQVPMCMDNPEIKKLMTGDGSAKSTQPGG